MYLSVSLFKKTHVVSSFSASPRDTSKHRFIFLGRGKQRTDVSYIMTKKPIRYHLDPRTP